MLSDRIVQVGMDRWRVVWHRRIGPLAVGGPGGNVRPGKAMGKTIRASYEQAEVQ
jgi:hypothetical protein